MKICIPTNDDRGLASDASGHFGDAPYFTVAEVDSADVKVVRNPACHEHHHACHHVDLLKAHDVDAVVCDGIGRRAVSGLREAGIEVLVPSARTVSDIVDAVKTGNARPLSDEGACGGGRRRP